MSRLSRRLQRASVAPVEAPPLSAEARFLETALRSRAARKARAQLRQMAPVVLRAPRWSAVGPFLEELALDLAVGEPGIGCRTVSLRTLHGRGLGEGWQFVLHIFGQLGRRGWSPSVPASVADRRGFRWALGRLLDEAHAAAPWRLALLAHGAEHLPFEIVEDIGLAWDEYRARHPEGPRVTVLLAAPPGARGVTLPGAAEVDLSDYAEAEAAAALVGRSGPLPVRLIEAAARFSGGVPDLIDTLGRQARAGGLGADPHALLGALGPMADEMRGAVDIVSAHDDLSDRLYGLLSGEPGRLVPAVDQPLLDAGLLRPVRAAGGPQVALRTPALALLVG